MALSLKAHSVVALARGKQAIRNVRTKACPRKPWGLDSKEVAYREDMGRKLVSREEAPNTKMLKAIARIKIRIVKLPATSETMVSWARSLGRVRALWM